MVKHCCLFLLFLFSLLTARAQQDSAATIPADTTQAIIVKPVIVEPIIIQPVIVAPPIGVVPRPPESTPATCKLKILVRGIKSYRGSLFIGLYNRAAGFGTDKAFRGVSHEIKGVEMSVSFDSIPRGSYAVAIIHDENNNKKLDQGEMGIPIEGYGFSNDARGIFGPPDYRLAMFFVSGTTDKNIIINLLYPKKK